MGNAPRLWGKEKKLAKLEKVKNLLNDAAKIKDAEINAAKTLLDAASPIYNKKLKYQKQKLKNGEFFNIFDVLGRRDDETKGHSAFLATLLDTKGLHGCGAKFLEAFRKVVCDDFGFDCENAYVVKEEYLGNKSEDGKTGGYIDIAIHQKGDKKKVIAIENKIWAGDQETQLLRYRNYCAKYGDGNWRLLYLTLDGHEPSDWSTNGELEKGKDYFTISYKAHISRWLESCKEIAKGKAGVLSSIEQYSNLIGQLTKQNEENKMDEKIIDLLLEGNNLEVAEEIETHIKAAKVKILKTTVFEALQKECGFTSCDSNNEDTVFTIEKPDWTKKNLCIRLVFENTSKPWCGISILDTDKNKSISQQIKNSIFDKWEDPEGKDSDRDLIWVYFSNLPTNYGEWDAKTYLKFKNDPTEFCSLVKEYVKRYSGIIDKATAPKKQK